MVLIKDAQFEVRNLVLDVALDLKKFNHPNKHYVSYFEASKYSTNEDIAEYITRQLELKWTNGLTYEYIVFINEESGN